MFELEEVAMTGWNIELEVLVCVDFHLSVNLAPLVLLVVAYRGNGSAGHSSFDGGCVVLASAGGPAGSVKFGH